MSSGNNTNGGNNGSSAMNIDWRHITSPDLLEQVEDSLKVQIMKFDEQLQWRCDKLMKRTAEEEAKRKAKEERKKAEEKAQKRDKFKVQRRAESERKVREKAEVMKMWIV